MPKYNFTETDLKRIAEIQEERSTTRGAAIMKFFAERKAEEKSAKKAAKAPKQPKAKKDRAAKAPKAEKEGRTPSLAAYVKGPLNIFGTFKGKELEAKVNADGTIVFDGETYTSPSVAAAKAINRKTCNGWKFWKYQNGDTQVFIDELRKAA